MQLFLMASLVALALGPVDTHGNTDMSCRNVSAIMDAFPADEGAVETVRANILRDIVIYENQRRRAGETTMHVGTSTLDEQSTVISEVAALCRQNLDKGLTETVEIFYDAATPP